MMLRKSTRRGGGQEEKKCSWNAVISGHLSCRHLEVWSLAPDASPCAPVSRKGALKVTCLMSSLCSQQRVPP